MIAICRDGDYYYVADPTGADVFGAPFPAPGVRVVFDEARMRAYGFGDALPLVHRVRGRQGLAVFESPLDAVTWPCRLWRVEALERVFRPTPNLYFLRCEAFAVIEEVPDWWVLGPHGDAVAQVVEQARHLDQQQVDLLATGDGEGEWQTFLAIRGRWDAHVEEHGPRRGRMLTPLGNGLSVVREAVEEAAARTSSELFGWVDDAVDAPVLAASDWTSARQAAMTAALAVGAPELLRGGEFDRLTRRWRTAVDIPNLDCICREPHPPW